MTDDIEVQRRRLLFRSTHRGSKETDLILGPYAEAMLTTLPPVRLVEFEAFLEESDADIWDWVTGKSDPPTGRYVELMQELRARHVVR